MASPTTLRSLITFALDELSAHNGQFEFEQLCQELIRSRIASNIVTATGPVNAGGDQGRDAETFETSLHRELGPHSAYLATVSGKPAGFCMTIQKTGLRAKFLEDARKVTGEGRRVESIYALCTARIAVGTRHDHETAIASAIGVAVTLLDGAWIAEQLSDPDLFWIAERYLDLPAEVRPDRPVVRDDGLPDDYVEIRARWRQRTDPPPSTPGDFRELRDGLRFAAEPGTGRPDLPFWLSHMSELLATADEELVLRVRYELAVAHILGRRDLTPADDHVRQFVCDALNESHPFRLHDAQVLLMFTYGMVRARRSAITASEWRMMHLQLREHLERLLTDEHPPTRRAHLWWTLGMLRVHPRLEDDDVADEPQEIPEIDVIREHVATYGSGGGAPLLDPRGAIEAWTKALDDIGGPNLLPVEPLSGVSHMVAGTLVEMSNWPAFTAKLDQAVAELGGRAAAAENAFDRAIALHDAGRVRQAVLELSAARIAWFSGDNLRQSAEVLLALSECYAELHLLEASQQFALAAVFLARAYDRDDLQDLVPRGLQLAAQADFVAGRWLRALRLLLPALDAHVTAKAVTHDVQPYDEILAPASQIATIVRASRVLNPRAAVPVEHAFSDGAKLMYDEILRDPTPLPSNWNDVVTEQLLGIPFADASEDHVFRFSALGLDWEIYAPADDEASSCAAARLAAVAQIACVELAGLDLCLIPGPIEMRVQSVVRDPVSGIPDLSGECVVLTTDAGPEIREGLVVEALAVVGAVLFERSLLPVGQFAAKIQPALSGDLRQRVFAGRQYDELFASAAWDYNYPLMTDSGSARECPRMPQHRDLPWQTGPGPTYSRERAYERLSERYSLFPRMLRGTLLQLRATPTFIERVEELRVAGWKDWHILGAVHSATRQFPSEFESWTFEQKKKYIMAAEPDEVPPIDEALITRDVLERRRRGVVVATVTPWGLELHTDRFRIDDLQRVMVERYNYWSDDIPHKDPFAPIE